MPKVSLILDRRYCRKDNTYPLRVRITNANTTAMLSTPYNILSSQWRNGKVIAHERAADINAHIRQYLLQIEGAIEAEFGYHTKRTAQEIRDKVIAVLEGRGHVLLSTAFDRFVSLKKKQNTIDSFTYTRARTFNYCATSITLDDITLSWLTRFDRWMEQQGMKVNTRAIHMENLRAVMNYANAEGLTDNYPFRRFRIRREQSPKRSLSLQEMRELWHIEPTDPYKAWYLDVFRLSFALCGLNIVDLYNLTPKSINGGRIEINRQKTGVFVSLPITPEAQAIMERIKGNGQHLLNIADKYKDYRHFRSRCNRGLKKIWPNLTTYYARHTWATIAAELGVPIEVIGLGLGHVYGSRITNIYITQDLRKLDHAVRLVLDAVTK